MYLSKGPGGGHFIYFWVSESEAVNNDKGDHLFSYHPFKVSDKNTKNWRVTSRSSMISPEVLTYWSKDNAL